MSLLIKPVSVELEINQHLVPSTGQLCDTDNHDGCDWETILKEGLRALYPEIQMSEPKPDNNKIKFTISYSNRPARKSDVANKLDQFFRSHPMMAVKSVKLNQF
jgi:hypothetical protein